MDTINTMSPIFVNKPVANIDYKYGPYDSCLQAFLELCSDNLDVLHVGLTVGITQPDGSIEEYWFKDKCEQASDLVKKCDFDDKFVWQ